MIGRLSAVRLTAGGVFVLLIGLTATTNAASIIDRIRTGGIIRCGAAERPGIAEELPDGSVGGIAADVCKALAVAVLGPQGKMSFSLYEAPKTFDPIRSGEEDVAFLTGSEIAEQGLGATIVPGPTVAVDEYGVMVHDTAPIRSLADLEGQPVCVMIGSAAQRAFEGAMAAARVSPVRLAFSEDVEMLDAFNAHRCAAAAGELTNLAGMRRNSGLNREPSRLLPEPLAAEPLIAATPVADGAWASAVAWVFDTLLLADAKDAWRTEGETALPAREIPGLRASWRQDIATAVGSYAGIVQRDFTEALGLPAGPNALWPAGMMMPITVR